MSFFSGTSNFNSPGPYDAFWQVGSFSDPDHITVYATNGRTFVELLQGLLRTTPSGQTYDGTTVSGSMVQNDGRFGRMTAKVLWLAAKNAGVGPATLAQMQREAISRNLNSDTRTLLVMAILRVMAGLANTPWVLTDANPNVRLPALDGTIPPRWGIEGPRQTAFQYSATRPEVAISQPYLPETIAADPQSAPPPPAPVVPSPPPPPEQGGPPIPQAPAGPEDLPPGVTTRPVVEGGGVSWGVIGVVGIGVLLVAALGVSLMKGPAGKTVRETQLRRPSRRRLATA